MESKVRIDQVGRLAIPANFLKALEIEIGDEIVLHLEEDSIRLVSQPEAIRKAQAKVKKYTSSNTSLADELIAKRGEEVNHE
jgi:bifunctional DNA-binding transcriptional regulator/antitoxin component of YhaV-PrlF toxin-antitoxin module